MHDERKVDSRRMDAPINERFGKVKSGYPDFFFEFLAADHKFVHTDVRRVSWEMTFETSHHIVGVESCQLSCQTDSFSTQCFDVGQSFYHDEEVSIESLNGTDRFISTRGEGINSVFFRYDRSRKVGSQCGFTADRA